jgi:tetratricopeptide (TPR) repeat protein
LARARLAEALMELDYVDRAKDELLRVSVLTPDRSVLPQLDALYLDAVTSTVRRDFPQAVKAYEEIARLSPNEAQVHVDLGRAYENNEEQKKAIESYVKATNLNQQYATAYLRVGVLYGRQQDQASASAAFDKAEALYQALGNIEGRAEVSFQRGYLLRNMGKSAEARPHLQRALELSRAASNPSQQIKTLLQLSYIAFSEGSTSQAQQYARDAIDLAQANGMENLTTRGLIDLGNVFFAKGEYDETEKYFKQALEFAQRNKGRRNEARALLSLGSLRIQQTNADEAVRYIEQALPFYQQGGYSKEASQALLLLGRANILKGDYDAALRAFEQQLQFAQSVGDPSQLALSHEGIGTVFTLQERYPDALYQFEQKYLTLKSTNDQKGIAYALVSRANVQWQLGHYDEAGAALKQASAVANRPDGGIKALSAQISQVEAEMALSQRAFTTAIEKAKQSLSSAGTQYPDIAVSAKRVLGTAQALSGARQEGKAACEEAVEMAKQSGDPWQMRITLLALAHAALERNDAQEALRVALQLQESFARSGQRESEWRAWLIAARASKRTGDEAKAQEYAARASELLMSLQQKWGDEKYGTYLTRADVQWGRKQLGEEFGVGR